MPRTVGLVMAGAGARGAYEAGALAAALRRLPRDDWPRVMVGTSAGSINVVLLASLAHLPQDEAVDELVRRWHEADREDVIAPVVPSGLASLGRYLAGVLHPVWPRRARPRLYSLLDNGPLRRTLRDPQWIDWKQLHDNVAAGLVDAVGVVATRTPDGGSVVFVEAGPDVTLPAYDPVRGITYVATRLDAHHVAASCAIPGAFPAEPVERPAAVRGWYVDGGVRLNTPIKPAIALGATHLLVVATDPPTRTAPRAAPRSALGHRPEVVDSVAQMLHSVLADRMVEDLATMVKVNRMVRAAAAGTDEVAIPASALDGPGRRRVVRYRFLGPRTDRLIADTARRVYEEEYGSPAGWALRWDFPVLSRVLGGSGFSHDDVLSYLFFDRAFLRELVELGHEDAEKRLASSPGWADVDAPR